MADPARSRDIKISYIKKWSKPGRIKYGRRQEACSFDGTLYPPVLKLNRI